MMDHGLSDFRLGILVGMTLMGYLAFPGISANLWRGLKDGLASRKTEKISRMKKEREERLRKYWEIDMRNFK